MLQPFSNVFFVNLLLSGDGLRIINKPAYPLKYLSDHSNHVQNPGSLLKVLAEQLLTFLRSLNNIGGNGHNLSEFEVAFDKVRQIGELKAQRLLVFGVPFLTLFVLNLVPLSACVGQEKSCDLRFASGSPIAQFYLAHFYYNLFTCILHVTVFYKGNAKLNSWGASSLTLSWDDERLEIGVLCFLGREF